MKATQFIETLTQQVQLFREIGKLANSTETADPLTEERKSKIADLLQSHCQYILDAEELRKNNPDADVPQSFSDYEARVASVIGLMHGLLDESLASKTPPPAP